MIWLRTSLSLLVCLQQLSSAVVDGAIDPDSCIVDSYYSSLSSSDPSDWTRLELAAHIKATHTESVPFNSEILGDGDVWAALKDLDAGDVEGTVHLTYVDADVPSVPFAGQRGWQKGYIWPRDRGIGDSGIDLSDLHSIRPAALSVLDIIGSKFFGQCGVLEKPGVCLEPAPGAASDTCSCNRAFEPPEKFRGVVARSLMYMDLRYDGSEPDTENLVLTDCPFDRERNMGYLSQMLEWHETYPPDADEIQRNLQVCQNFQGNRNPFVDYPEIASTIYGDPLPQPEAGREIYAVCEDVPTDAPTFSPNECQMIRPGDVWPFVVNSEEPENVGWFPIEDIPGGIDLFITDNAWDGTKFLSNEGVRKFTVPAEGIDGGTVFGYGPEVKYGTEWSPVEGLFSLSSEGDQVFLFCIGSGGTPVPIAGISYNGNWSEPGLDNYGLGESALPDRLKEGGAVALPHLNNYVFDIGEQILRTDEVKAEFMNLDNWRGSDSGRLTINPPEGAATVSGAIMTGWLVALALVPIGIVIIF